MVADNLLNQNFTAESPGAVWVTDISYVHTLEGWLYLATVKDVCTKDIARKHDKYGDLIGTNNTIIYLENIEGKWKVVGSYFLY